MLSDQILDEQTELSRAAELGILAEEAHVIIRMQVSSQKSANSYVADIQHSLLFNNMRSYFEGYGFSIRTIKDTGEHIVLLSAPGENRNLSDLNRLCALFSNNVANHYGTLNITAGCGRPHTGITGLAQSDREARIALRAAQNCKQSFTCFDELDVLRLICADNPAHEIDIFVHETLGSLIEYDRTKNAELLRTLECYLKNMGNLRQVSKDMYTHYNTITYRLKILSGILRSVIGSVFLITAATIMFSGIDTIVSDERTLKNTVIAGSTLSIAVMLPYHCASTFSEWASGLPSFINMLVASPTFLSVVVDIVLNLLLNHVLKNKEEQGRQSFGKKNWISSTEETLEDEPRTRGVTRIREMVDMGIYVITAQDTICDGFHLYGTGDPLDYGLVGCYCAQYNTPETARIMWDMLTSGSARAFDPDAKYGIQIGNDADLNIVDAPSVHGAIRIRASHPYILRRGKVIAGFERKAAML